MKFIWQITFHLLGRWLTFEVHPWLIDSKAACKNREFITYLHKLIMHYLFSEISKVRSNLFQINGYVKEPLILPEGSGPPVIHSEKVYVPVKEHPDVSLVKRHFEIIPIISFGNKHFLSNKKSDFPAYLSQKSCVIHKKRKTRLRWIFCPCFYSDVTFYFAVAMTRSKSDNFRLDWLKNSLTALAISPPVQVKSCPDLSLGPRKHE